MKARISEEWLLRVILAAPNVSGRALAESFTALVGSDRHMIHRDSIKCIRAAFVEMWKELTFSTVREFIDAQCRAAAAAGATSSTTRQTRAATAATGASGAFVGVFMSHVQDEAELRLLSSDASSRPGQPRRSRTSKVQMHVVQISCEGRTWDMPTELEGLADKTAATLATSFEKLLLTMLRTLVPCRQEQDGSHRRRTEIWFVHTLIGDGIATNEAAAKILLAIASTEHTVTQRVRYFLLLGKCGTHQAALSAKTGVIGRAAAKAAAAAGEGKEFEFVTATCVRLFKYVVPQYYEDLANSAERWIRENVTAVVPPPPQAAGQPQATLARLQALYTKHVIPDALLQLWSDGAAPTLQTYLRVGEDIEAGTQRIRDEWLAFLTTRLFHVDAHPTLTRFFTFRGCVDRLLTLSLLRFPETGGLGVKPSANKDSQMRMKRIIHFFKQHAASQALRRASLVRNTDTAPATSGATPATGGATPGCQCTSQH